MTILPTYEQIGITATYAITLCRAMQGLSFSTELIGTHLYLTETIKPPSIYPIVALSSVSFSLGGTIALIIAYFATSYSINWRSVFAFGILAAMIGITARVTLQET
ncbi:MAG: hypothetical protein ACIPMY_01175 [Rickettsia endosymbiont of Pentastiridius leporinus]